MNISSLVIFDHFVSGTINIGNYRSRLKQSVYREIGRKLNTESWMNPWNKIIEDVRKRVLKLDDYESHCVVRSISNHSKRKFTSLIEKIQRKAERWRKYLK